MIDYNELNRQIGRMVILSVSGGKHERVSDNTLRFPISHGYAVEVELDEGSDTYTVRRTYTRKPKGELLKVRAVKGERADVHADEVSQAFYYAGMFRSYDADEWVTKR